LREACPDSPPLVVSGAGLAGLAAALAAGQGGAVGRRVVVFERSPDVGHRFHDDFQGIENWTTDGDALDELAALGIAATFEHVPVREVVLFDPRDRAHTYRSLRPFFYLVRRGAGAGAVDAALKAQALARGIEFRFGEKQSHPLDSGVVAEGPRRSDVITVGYVFTTRTADGIYAAFSDRLAPQGYAYLLVSRGRGTIASCMFGDFVHERDYLERTVAFFRERVGVEMQKPRRFGGIGTFGVPRTARHGDLLFAGEAAGFQDALWGFGMRYAVVSGALAAQVLLSGRLEEYDRLWQRRFGALLRAGIVNRFLFGNLGARGYVALAKWLDRAPDPRGWLRRRYRPSLVKTLLYPIARRAVGGGEPGASPTS
jgi:flavin-dependent dehydrogenase